MTQEAKEQTDSDVEDLSFLLSEIRVAEDDPALDPTDSVYSKIFDLANDGRIEEAAAKVGPLLSAGVYDLRILSVYLVDRFLVKGLAFMPRLLDATVALVSERLEAFGPRKKRESHLDRRLAWTFEKITLQARYYEQAGGDRWERWHEGVSVEQLELAMESAAKVEAALAQRGAQAYMGPLGGLRSWLRERKESLRSRPAAESAAETIEGGAEPELEPASAGATAPSQSTRSRASGSFSPIVCETTLAISDRFVRFERKLAAFSQLIGRGEHKRAAIVSQDLLREIESFDPRAYFPELFAEMSSLLNREVSQLCPHWEDNSIEMKMLRQLYEVDLQRFVDEG